MSLGDFLGQPLSVGDIVVFPAPQYRHLVKGIVIGFTPKKVRIEYSNTWNHSAPGYKSEYLTEPGRNVIKI